MKVLVFGGAGFLGAHVAQALRARGHKVLTVGRSRCDVTLDVAQAPEHLTPQLAALLEGETVVVNAIGMLIERGANTFAAVHERFPQALAVACSHARVARLVHVSAIGAGTGMAGRYMRSKERGEHAVQAALATSSTDCAIVRPALLTGCFQGGASPATRLFRALARLPVVALPGVLHSGQSLLAPIEGHAAAERIASICECERALKNTALAVAEMEGPVRITYQEMMAAYRLEAGGHRTLWLPLPWWLMMLTAHAAEWLPANRVFSRDVLRMLRFGGAARHAGRTALGGVLT